MESRFDGTIVLAHGAWADGSSWSEVIRLLGPVVPHVVAVPLPLSSLADDAAALRRTLARTRGPVILVGHAYAGAVIATANEDRVRALVYIAALAPAEGESVAQVFYREAPHASAAQLSPDRDGWIWMPDSGFAGDFAHHATAEQITLLKAVQRPIALQCIQAPVPAPLWASKPSWFLVAEEDRIIHPKTQWFMAERMGATIHSRRVDHLPLLTAPQQVVEIILAAVDAVTTEASSTAPIRRTSAPQTPVLLGKES